MSRRVRRAMSALVVIGALAIGGAVLLPAGAADVGAVTKKVNGGEYAGLSVTVSKTENLINEVVEISWSGAKPTEPAGGLARHFLQIVQCWGDDPAGPRPEQCQFGAIGAVTPDPNSGSVLTRQVRYPESSGFPIDPEENHPAGENGVGYVGFEAANGTVTGGRFDEFKVFFDPQGTNEIPRAPTRGDGTGQEFFEIQTANEAPGLGCGQRLAGGKVRACWLVVVPRGDLEVDGSRVAESAPRASERQVQSSPLSATNWAKRITFPLTFQSLGGQCPSGSGEMLVLGHESATEAVTRWQQALCTATKKVFAYNQLSDSAARSSLTGDEPLLSVLSAPLPPGTGGVVYAPIALSGFGFAYNLEVRTADDDPPAIKQRAGERITNLRLNQRLVAKLLTQSYRSGVTVPAVLDPKNPARLEDDPEFLDLNPHLKSVNRNGANSIWTVVTPLTPSDAIEQVWRWIGADPDARAFLDGRPDPSGMVINPAWKDMSLPRPDFPKPDQSCRPRFPGEGNDLCVPDAFPYAGDMREAVLAASRGDTLARNSWDPPGPKGSFKKSAPQPRGSRGVMVVADTATAARYNLPMAALRNANGRYVAPSPASLLAAAARFPKSPVAGVLTADPTVRADTAYPLTVISYAATVPAKLTATQRAAYAGFLAYAGGTGQKPGLAAGSLPAGYAPLPTALAAATKAAAATVRNYRPAAIPTPRAEPRTTPRGGAGAGTGSGGGTGAGGGSGSPAAPGPVDPANPVDQPPAEPLPPAPIPDPGPTAPQPLGGLTPVSAIGSARYGLLWVLAAGVLAIVAGRVLPRVWAPTTGLVRTGAPKVPDDGGGAGAKPADPQL